MDRHQSLAEVFMGNIEVTKVGFGVMLAAIAIAFVIEGGEIVFVFGALDVDTAMGRPKRAVTSEAGWKDAVEHIDASFDAFEEVVKGTDAHKVTWFFWWEVSDGVFDHLDADVSRLADGSATDGIAREVHGREFFGAHLTEILEGRTLDDAKESLIFTLMML